MKTLSAVGIAELTVIASPRSAAVVIDVYNGGSASHMSEMFSHLDGAAINLLAGEEVAFLRFEHGFEGLDAFLKTIDGCIEEQAPGMIGGTVTLVWNDPVTGVATVAWDLDDRDRPVRDGNGWAREVITSRL